MNYLNYEEQAVMGGTDSEPERERRSKMTTATQGRKEAELATCVWCGYEGVYGVDVVDTGKVDSTGRDTLAPGCKAVEACWERIVKKERKDE